MANFPIKQPSFNLFRMHFTEDFSKPKMLWKRVGSILRFCYNDNETLGLDSTCFATGENMNLYVAY